MAALVADCGIYTGSLAKIARDVTLLMQHEVAEASERGGGSSAMPHKRNPAGSAVALAAAGRVPGLVAAYLGGMAQEHERAAGAWQAEWQTVADVVQATGSALAAVVEVMDGLTVDEGSMRANLAATRGAVFSEKAAMLLAASVGRDKAKTLVAEALRAPSLRDGLAGLLTPEELEKLEAPEDYLGSAEVFRRQLLKTEE
jgi:3-carboxy-cis,cis-muconate cycloisomerase